MGAQLVARRDGLTKSSWGAAPAAGGAFNVTTEAGVLAPFGEPGQKIWDPAGLAKDISPEQFRMYRAAELKHGRVAMLATLGLVAQASGLRFPGLADMPSGIQAAV